MPGSQMTSSDASRIQSGQAKAGNDMSSGGFAARAQAAGDRNASQQSSGHQAPAGNNGGGQGGKK